MEKQSDSRMPKFLMEKMENLIKKWTEIESAVTNEPINESVVFDHEFKKEVMVNKEEEVDEKRKHSIEALSNSINAENKDTFLKKTNSTDSIKSKTIVTPIELETNEENAEIRKELNIIKLENDSNIVNVNNEMCQKSESIRSSKVLTFSSTDNGEMNLEENEDLQLMSNDLFDWLLWIDHTLDSQIVVVGDLEEIKQSINKYEVIF